MTGSDPQVHVQIEQDDRSTSVAAYFAIRLDSIGTCTSDQGQSKDWLARLLDRQISLIASLPGVGVGSAVELRYAAAPQPESPHLGRVEVLLRVKVTGSSVDEASNRASTTFRGLYAALVATDEAYDWVPVGTEADYTALFESSAMCHVGELVRRQATIHLGRIESLQRQRAMGFMAFDDHGGSAAESAVQVIAPFVPTFAGLEQLFDLLLLQPSKTMVSVVLTPTNLGPEELRHLTGRAARCERFLHDPRASLGESDSAPPLLAQAQMLLVQLNDMLFSLRDDCFTMTIQVAGENALNPILFEAVGNSVTGHATANEGPTGGSQGTVMRGGYDWMIPAKDPDRDAMLTRLRHMDHAHLDADPADRLRYLFDARQANCAFRLPLPTRGAFPGLTTRRARALPPPMTSCGDGMLIGENVYRGVRRPVMLLDDDRRRHLYILGQTGTGKSSLLRNMILQDIEANRGVAVLDPHGELVDAILPCIPRHRVDDVIYINPEMEDLTVGLNLLEHTGALERDRVVNQLLEIFYRLYSNVPEALGPAFELYFRNSALLEMADTSEPPMLDGILRIFNDPQYRKTRLAQCRDPLIAGFWHLATKGSGDYSLENFGLYITNKLSRILYNTLIRRIVLQPRSTIDFSEVLNGGRILLVDLCKGRLGDTNTAFLGMLLTALIQRAAFARTSAADKGELRDFHLYIDEFQNVATDSFITILSEARKYRLCATLTNQYLHQIPKEIANAVSGNVGSMLVFRTGAVDADLLVQEFGTAVEREDLLNLPNFHAYMKTLVQGQAIAPFSLRTIPLEETHHPGVTTDIMTSRSRYAMPVRDVDVFIAKRWAM